MVFSFHKINKMVWDKYKKSQWKMNYSMQIYHPNKYTIYENQCIKSKQLITLCNINIIKNT